MPAPTILTESVLTFAEVRDLCPAVGGRKPSVKTVYTWADSGVKVGAVRVKLETARVGGRRVTSREALSRFFAATVADGSEPAPSIDRTPAQRKRAGEQARDRVRAWCARK